MSKDETPVVCEECRRLLILSCSKLKLPAVGLLPAIQLYDGPAYRVLRRFQREQPASSKSLDVFVLSAAHGLIPGHTPLAAYDNALTADRVTDLRDGALLTLARLLNQRYATVCLAMGGLYLRAVEGWANLAPPGVSVTVADGAQGVRLARLKSWLWQEGTSEAGRCQTTPRNPSGIAHLRGTRVVTTAQDVLQIAGRALNKDASVATRFRRWYVELDGQRLAPKWLVEVLTGVPRKRFTSGEARRLLHQIGIECIPVKETSQ
jgi:hypothetical protein